MILIAIGTIVITVVVWKIRGHRRHGDGTIEQFNDAWFLGDGPP